MKMSSFITAIVATVALVSGGASAETVSRSPDRAAGCDGVRPGAHVTTSKGTGGTLNFLFRDRDGIRYVATAGHLLADENRHVWRGDTGPTAKIDDGTIIGRAVFAENYNGRHVDVALIRLYDDVSSNPSVCYWGGPTAINNDASDQPQLFHLYGNGLGISTVSPERTLFAARMTNPLEAAAVGVVAPGDSGSPVIDEKGRAVGIQYLLGVVWGGTPGTQEFGPGTVAIMRLGPQIEIAERALDTDLKLMTAPLASP